MSAIIGMCFLTVALVLTARLRNKRSMEADLNKSFEASERRNG